MILARRTAEEAERVVLLLREAGHKALGVPVEAKPYWVIETDATFEQVHEALKPLYPESDE